MNDEAEVAFQAREIPMTTIPMLAMPNFKESFTIEIDASGEGIGAVLTQQNIPTAYTSRALGITNFVHLCQGNAGRNGSNQVAETLFTWQKIYIMTDQRSLKFFLDQRVATPKQQTSAANLLGFDMKLYIVLTKKTRLQMHYPERLKVQF